MDKINAITGKDYKFFNYYGHPEADRPIVVMGSGASVVEETIGEPMRRGEVGMVNVRLYRPSCRKAAGSRPASVKRIAVLDCTRSPGPAIPVPRRAQRLCLQSRCPAIYAGRYGLASKDFTPAQASRSSTIWPPNSPAIASPWASSTT